MNSNKSHLVYLILIIGAIASLIYIPLIGNSPLFDWDEINFAECAREMIITGDYSTVQINYQPFWEKPPMFIWFQALSMKIFGINEFGARFPNALNGVLTLISLFLIGTKLQNKKFGITWALLYAGTILPTLYFKSGVIDPWFNFFIFLGISFFVLSFNEIKYSKLRYIVLSALAIGLAVLTKGPAAILISGITIFLFIILSKNLQVYLKGYFYIFIALVVLTSISWFGWIYFTGKSFIIEQFIEYQIRLFKTEDSGHSGPIFYHLLVLLLGCFPASILFIMFYKKPEYLDDKIKIYRTAMLILFWVVLVIFSLVKTKIVHYSSLCYYPLTFIVALGITNVDFQERFKTFARISIVLIGVLISLALTAFAFLPIFKQQLLDGNLIQDDFAKLNLEVNLINHGYEWIVPFLFIASITIIFIALKSNNYNKLVIGFVMQIAFIISAINIFVPKAELISQRTAICFYKEMAKHDFYVETNNFKSYAYIFYADRKPHHHESPLFKDFLEYFYSKQDKDAFKLNYYATAHSYWMKIGKIDKPAFIVNKTTNDKQMEEFPEMKKCYSMNGFSFYVRMPTHDK
ncbi:MAG: ArnT family glycosyltransferase [Bacteroidia bacterium]